MSMRHLSRRVWPVALVLVPAALLATPSSDAGWTYDFKVTSSSVQGDKTREGTALVGRTQMTSDNARIDLTEARNGGPMLDGKGGYVIVKDGGTMYMVDPSKKEYFAFNMEQMVAGVSSTLKMVGGMVKMTMSDVKMDLQDMGAGESIQGHSTRHVRQTQSHTMSVSVLGRTSTTTTVDTTDIWIAPDLKNVGNPFLAMGNAAAAGLGFDNPEFRNQHQAVMAKMPAGLPLKSVSRNHSTDDKGNTTLTTSTMEVTNIQQGDVPSSAFAIPGDFSQVQMPFAELAALGDSVDAAKAREGVAADADNGVSGEGVTDAVKEGVKEGVKEATKSTVKEEAKKKLRGIFGRP